MECGACLRVLEGHEELVRCIRFDSKRIVSGAYDGWVWLNILDVVWGLMMGEWDSIYQVLLVGHVMGEWDSIYLILLVGPVMGEWDSIYLILLVGPVMGEWDSI